VATPLENPACRVSTREESSRMLKASCDQGRRAESHESTTRQREAAPVGAEKRSVACRAHIAQTEFHSTGEDGLQSRR